MNYSLVVLEVGSLKSKSQQGWTPSKTVVKNPSLPFQVCACQLSVVHGPITWLLHPLVVWPLLLGLLLTGQQ